MSKLCSWLRTGRRNQCSSGKSWRQAMFLFVALLLWCLPGCGQGSQSVALTTESVDLDHRPESLIELSQDMRQLLKELDQQTASDEDKSTLAKLVALAPEYAADTDLAEKQWLPIHRLSESIFQSIQSGSDPWGIEQQKQVTQLCQLSEDAWATLAPEKQTHRFLPHNHDDHDHHHHGDHHDDEHDDDHDDHHDHDEDHHDDHDGHHDDDH